MADQLTRRHHPPIPERSQTTLQMEQLRMLAEHDALTGAALVGEMRLQLTRAFVVGSLGETDQVVRAHLADVASVERAGRLDGAKARDQRLQRSADPRHFATPAGRPRMGEHGASGQEHGSILDEGRIGMIVVGLERNDANSAVLERAHVVAVLGEGPLEIRGAEMPTGETAREAGARRTDDRGVEHARILHGEVAGYTAPTLSWRPPCPNRIPLPR